MAGKREPPGPTECQALICRWDTVRPLTDDNSMWVHPHFSDPDDSGWLSGRPILTQRLRIHRECYDRTLYSPV